MYITDAQMLKDTDILHQIDMYKWLESEKAGFDIGFEKAAREWISIHSKTYFMTRPLKFIVLWFKSQPIYELLKNDRFY